MNGLRKNHWRWLLIGGFSILSWASGGTSSPLQAESPLPLTISFNRDIRPILSDKCFQCHGPDKNQRKADLRFDVVNDALGNKEHPGVIVPGEPDKSELLRRLLTTDADEKMPPPDSGRQLTATQIALIRRWIEQGAPWEKHWSLLPPKQVPLPVLKVEAGGDRLRHAMIRNPVDLFIQQRLAEAGLIGSPEAPRESLLRRAAFDLTGLPPAPDEVDEFISDGHPGAFERQVDRLLASPRHGERMAVRWLDAARYADTSGYQSDGPRFMWRWRDWVLEAFNRAIPFDQFTIEQLAGDLLPNPTLDQRIATGFNRNHRGNSEGGIVPEEYAVEYVVDRVDTTTTVWLGLTAGCARCHDHKFDPLSQREFYQLFAFFNNVPEFGRAIKEGNSPPYITAPTPAEQERLRQLDAAITAAEAHVKRIEPQARAAQAEWEQTAGNDDTKLAASRPVNPADWTVKAGQVVHLPLQGPAAEEAGEFSGERYIDAGDVANFGYFDKFSFSVWVNANRKENESGGVNGAIVSRMADVPQGDGYCVQLVNGRLQLNLVKRWLDDALRVETETTLPAGWHHVAVTYDGSRQARGVRIYFDGQSQRIVTHLDGLNQTFAAKEPLRIGGGGGIANRFRGQLCDVRVYQRALDVDEVTILATPESPTQIARRPITARTESQSHKISRFFREERAAPEIRDAFQNLFAVRRERDAFLETISTVMVMEELPQPRTTFVLKRGEYDKPTDQVVAAVPAALPALAKDVAHNRLEFARWLVAPSNPLTARVAVNRCWQMLFGTGLVRTVEDFGTQGEAPSHPELLDWLATEFGDRGDGNGRASFAWDQKHLLRLLVTSGTYRQSSTISAESLARDPANRLLARGPRGRLSAEMIRDQALAASGLLVERVGGPSVKPYQPADLWKDLATDNLYVQDHGERLYRRSLYTFWKRTVAPPTLVTFDAAGRETCIVRESRTNTPLQALVLLNDVTFVEAARVLAERTMQATDQEPERLAFLFRQVLSRRPTPHEQRLLLTGWQQYRDRFQKDAAAAMALVSSGEAPRDPKLLLPDLAAWTTIASVVLNLDEAVTKE